jgi:hypothetical protein
LNTKNQITVIVPVTVPKYFLILMKNGEGTVEKQLEKYEEGQGNGMARNKNLHSTVKSKTIAYRYNKFFKFLRIFLYKINLVINVSFLL